MTTHTQLLKKIIEHPSVTSIITDASKEFYMWATGTLDPSVFLDNSSEDLIELVHFHTTKSKDQILADIPKYIDINRDLDWTLENLRGCRTFIKIPGSLETYETKDCSAWIEHFTPCDKDIDSYGSFKSNDLLVLNTYDNVSQASAPLCVCTASVDLISYSEIDYCPGKKKLIEVLHSSRKTSSEEAQAIRSTLAGDLVLGGKRAAGFDGTSIYLKGI